LHPAFQRIQRAVRLSLFSVRPGNKIGTPRKKYSSALPATKDKGALFNTVHFRIAARHRVPDHDDIRVGRDVFFAIPL
jgi:hypothetical protein